MTIAQIVRGIGGGKFVKRYIGTIVFVIFVMSGLLLFWLYSAA